MYAGSLGERKNRFLYAFPPLIPSCIIAVCGRGLDEDKVSNPDGNFIYRGFVPSEQFIDSPDGDWGLVWDGDLTDCCGGVWGEYLRINNPHKASFYIRSSIPVIVWKHSAMAPFITANHLGIAVESLADLETLLPQITPEQYSAYAAACADFARRLDEGHFFRRAVAKSLIFSFPRSARRNKNDACLRSKEMLVCGLKRCLSKSAECLFADVWRIGIKLLPL